ncbi:ABC transporter ATP-binding protein [Micromonospora sp. NPDC005367]|uniref:ABC transporter ATP-binding protein n=1 Tax=Micromonospora sp. NPDC005367 TaxID=3155590 RepID=UPI0033BE88FB
MTERVEDASSPAGDAPLLEVTGLAAGYGGIEVLHGVDLAVRAATATTLIGSNGAGKTTLLKTMVGLVRPSRGRVRLRGEDITDWSVQRRTRAGLVLVPEGRRVFAALSVHENLLLGAYGRRRSAVAASADEVYGRFPRLAERRRQPAGTLSGGEQQMLAIGRALMAAPTVMLLDEPSLGLAPKAVAEVTGILTALAGAGTTLVLVEQNASVAFRVASAGYLLDRGRISLAGEVARLRADPQVRAAYLGLGTAERR